MVFKLEVVLGFPPVFYLNLPKNKGMTTMDVPLGTNLIELLDSKYLGNDSLMAEHIPSQCFKPL